MKGWIKNLVTTAGALLFSVLLAETVLRIAGVEFPIFKRADPVSGTSYLPGASGWYSREGRAYIRINSQGFRDREHLRDKPPDTLRIAVLGDSFTAAFEVAMEDTYWAIMERQLNEELAGEGRKIEVLSFGVAGFGTAQAYLTLHHKVWDYSPDLILLAVCTGNDLRDNHREMSHKDYIPYFFYQGDTLVLDDSYLRSRGYRKREHWTTRFAIGVSRHSRMMQLIYHVWSLRSESDQRRHRQSIAEQVGVELGFDSQIYTEPSIALWQEAWKVTEGLLSMIDEEVRQKGARFLLVTLSNGNQVHPDAERREKLVSTLGVVDLFYPERRLKTFGEQRGIDVLNLAPLLQEYAEREGLFFHGFGDRPGVGHWNERGHRQAGDLIARWILDEVLRVGIQQ